MSNAPSANDLRRVVAEARLADGPSAEAFDTYLTERALDRTQIQELADLYLAFACVVGSDDARRRLAEELWQVTVVSTAVPQATVDDARQVAFERLLAFRNPKIASYDGRGPLRGWLRVVLAREALALQKQSKLQRGPSHDWMDALVEVAAPSEDPESATLKADLWAQVRAALKRAAGSLPSKERALLRQHLALGMSIEVLSPVYGVHRATIARWIAAAKDEFVARFHAEMQANLGLRRPELASVYALVQNRLDIGLASVFATLRDTTARGGENS